MRYAAHVARLLGDQRFLVVRIFDQRELDLGQLLQLERPL